MNEPKRDPSKHHPCAKSDLSRPQPHLSASQQIHPHTRPTIAVHCLPLALETVLQKACCHVPTRQEVSHANRYVFHLPVVPSQHRCLDSGREYDATTSSRRGDSAAPDADYSQRNLCGLSSSPVCDPLSTLRWKSDSLESEKGHWRISYAEARWSLWKPLVCNVADMRNNRRLGRQLRRQFLCKRACQVYVSLSFSQVSLQPRSICSSTRRNAVIRIPNCCTENVVGMKVGADWNNSRHVQR